MRVLEVTLGIVLVLLLPQNSAYDSLQHIFDVIFDHMLSGPSGSPKQSSITWFFRGIYCRAHSQICRRDMSIRPEKHQSSGNPMIHVCTVICIQYLCACCQYYHHHHSKHHNASHRYIYICIHVYMYTVDNILDGLDLESSLESICHHKLWLKVERQSLKPGSSRPGFRSESHFFHFLGLSAAKVWTTLLVCSWYPTMFAVDGGWLPGNSPNDLPVATFSWFFFACQLFQRLSDSMLALGLDFGGAECFLKLGSPLPCKDIEF